MAMRKTDMTGRRVMITGCTAGLGRAATIAIADMGADLSLVCRNAERGEALARELRDGTAYGDVDLYVGDMGSQDDIRSIAERFLATDRPLHVLFNNAGVIMQRHTTTRDGLETTFGVNHIGYFLLTMLLLDRLEASAPARIVNTASDAHRHGIGRLDFDDLQGEKGFSFIRAYAGSKLANILFTRELAKRIEGRGVTVNAFHPGFVGSDFSKNNGLFASILMTALRPFARSPLRGAETGIYLCTSPDVEGQSGGYYYDCKPYEPAAHALNDDDAARLWSVSEHLVGAPFG